MNLSTRMSMTALTATLLLAAPLAVAAGDDRGRHCDAQRIEAQQVAASGKAVMCVTGNDVYGAVVARGLKPGDAYTVWWVYFDDPPSCMVPGECGVADFGGDDPLGVFGRMDSGVAPRSGRMAFSGRVRGLDPSDGAQIWMWIFGHGAVDSNDGRHRARQLLTPEDPSAGAPHLGLVGGPFGVPAAVVMFDVP